MSSVAGVLGDRVIGPSGVGTVVGASANPLLRGVAVSVRWDAGYQLDERVSSLRKLPPTQTPGVLIGVTRAGAGGAGGPAVGGLGVAPTPSLAPPMLGGGRAPVPTYAGGAAATKAPRTVMASYADVQGLASPLSPGGSIKHGVASSPQGSPQLRHGGGPVPYQPALWTAAHAVPVEAWADRASPLDPPALDAQPVLPHGRGLLDRRRGQDGPGHLGALVDYSSGGLGPSPSSPTAAMAAARPRLDSQHNYADRSQTVIVFDWDDTLFPTSYLLDDMQVDWRMPLSLQTSMSSTARQEATQKLAECEERALETLRRAYLHGQVAIVTLAKTGWVDKACHQFYKQVGNMLRNFRIPVIYALDSVHEQQMHELRARCRNDEEYYGLVKGRAISEEVDKCYSQYEGQTWKNVISIGDSRFERYGLLAASTAYMQGRRMSGFDAEPQSPEKRGVWEKVGDEGLVRLRVKCCKLVDRPDMDELAIELKMVSRWLDRMVKLDEGFDMDIEALKDQAQIAVVEEVLRGERPVTHLPKRF